MIGILRLVAQALRARSTPAPLSSPAFAVIRPDLDSLPYPWCDLTLWPPELDEVRYTIPSDRLDARGGGWWG